MAKVPLSARFVAFLLLACDTLGLFGSFAVSHRMRFGEWSDTFGWTILWPTAITLFSLYVVDVYRTETQVAGMRAPARTILGVAIAGLFTAAVVYAGGYWGSDQLFGRGVFLVALILFAGWASLCRLMLSVWVRQRAGEVRWLVLGAGEPTALLWKDFRRHVTGGQMVALAVDDNERHQVSLRDLPPVIGTLRDIEQLTGERYSGIIIALPPPLPDELVQRLMRLRFSGHRVYDLADFYERHWFKVPVFHLQNGWFVFSHGFDLLQNTLGLRMKRVLDATFSMLLLVGLAPLLGLVASLIRLDSPGPSIYRQTRVGEGGRTFTLYKFRSMQVDAEKDGVQWASKNDSRVTRLGRLLRLMRLDELPQLINVFRGEMSFIGPRPERPEFVSTLENEIPYYELRSLVKPGITGWAQVMYPYGASVVDAREKLQYDFYYIKNYSVLLDLAIVFKTLRVIFMGQGR